MGRCGDRRKESKRNLAVAEEADEHAQRRGGGRGTKEEKEEDVKFSAFLSTLLWMSSLPPIMLRSSFWFCGGIEITWEYGSALMESELELGFWLYEQHGTRVRPAAEGPHKHKSLNLFKRA